MTKRKDSVRRPKVSRDGRGIAIRTECSDHIPSYWITEDEMGSEVVSDVRWSDATYFHKNSQAKSVSDLLNELEKEIGIPRHRHSPSSWASHALHLIACIRRKISTGAVADDLAVDLFELGIAVDRARSALLQSAGGKATAKLSPQEKADLTQMVNDNMKDGHSFSRACEFARQSYVSRMKELDVEYEISRETVKRAVKAENDKRNKRK